MSDRQRRPARSSVRAQYARIADACIGLRLRLLARQLQGPYDCELRPGPLTLGLSDESCPLSGWTDAISDKLASRSSPANCAMRRSLVTFASWAEGSVGLARLSFALVPCLWARLGFC